jgi:hypothetical protein
MKLAKLEESADRQALKFDELIGLVNGSMEAVIALKDIVLCTRLELKAWPMSE